MRFRRKLIILDVVTIVVVILLFQLIREKRIAALCASFVFLANGLTVAARARSIPSVFYINFVFVIAFVLPLPILRLLHWNESFENITLFGVPAPWLHQMATAFYVLKMLVDGIQRGSKARKERG